MPTSAELLEIEQERLPILVQDDPLFDYFPIEEVDAHLVKWDQLDNFGGLQAVRGLDGALPRVKKTGSKQYIIEPGVYGEFEEVGESELTARRQLGTFGQPVNVDQLVMQMQEKLLQRRLDRIRLVAWTLFATGTFSVARPAEEGGGVLHTDTFPLQNFTANPLWSVFATSTPLYDLRRVVLKQRGRGVWFDGRAKLFMNYQTWLYMAQNTNAADLGGRRVGGFGTVNDLAAVNEILTKDNLPNIVVYDLGYTDDTGAASTFVPFIPDGKAVLIGKRQSGGKVGAYYMTRNAQNADMGPGPVTRVLDLYESQLLRKLVVADYHAGGPAVQYPGSIVYLNVA